MRVDIVIPADNEEDRIDGTLEQYRNRLDDADFRFLVALDGCTDGTADAATPPEEFLRLLDAAARDADGAICSRWHPASVVPGQRSFKRTIASTAFTAELVSGEAVAGEAR